MSEEISFTEFLIDLFKHIVSLIHCPNSGPVLQWHPLNSDDISIIKNILSESDGQNTIDCEESTHLNQLIIRVNNWEKSSRDNSSESNSDSTKEDIKVKTTDNN